MTAKQYHRLEILLAEAEAITLEHPLLTPQGKSIQGEVRKLLALVAAEKIRAEQREDINRPDPG
jgi:hypothetical protein